MDGEHNSAINALIISDVIWLRCLSLDCFQLKQHLTPAAPLSPCGPAGARPGLQGFAPDGAAC